MTNGEMTAGRIPSRVSVNPNFAPDSGDHQVADGAQAHPAAERRTLDPDDDGDGARVERLEHVGHRHRVLLVALDVERHRRAHPGDVGTGAEGRAVAGQDDEAKLVRGLPGERRERLAQLGDERRVERVVDLGPGERDPGDAVRGTGPLHAKGGHHGIVCRPRWRGAAHHPGMRTEDLLTTPPDLPMPVDDGAADHLPGTAMPPIALARHGRR